MQGQSFSDGHIVSSTEVIHVLLFTILLVLYNIFTILFSVALGPDAGYGLIIHEVFRSHATTHHIR
jgi:hypothetical protein